ncbi:MAG: MurR/RpiR family transcriptional regulator [Romboutsia sp.]|uniref:MurR/RpiR family transcriptional regulator n=1 Tax=Romboutsia sp. TaxID=1965302 RepID=UPI003F396792
MNFLDLIDKYKLDTLEIDILKYLYKNIDIIKTIGVRKVSKENFTSTATVYKLVKKLGFDGYADMIYSIYYDRKNSQIENNMYDIIENQIIQVREDFLNILEEYRERRIIVTGMGFSQIVADYIHESLFLKGFRVTSKMHVQFLEKNYKSKVLLIVISHSGDTPRLVELAQKAKNNDISIISITGSKNNKINKLANIQVSIESNKFCGEAIIAFDLLTSSLK